MSFKLKITEDDVLDILNSHKKKSGDQYVTKCPYCGKDDHFYIGYRTDRQGWFWDCKKCKEEGGMYRLLSFLGRLDEFLDKTIDLNTLNKLSEDIGLKNDEFEDISLDLPEKRLPIGYRRIFSNEYLESRGFSNADFYNIEVGSTDLSTKFKDYVIFPIRQNGKVVGYVGRSVLSKEECKQQNKLRYNNSKSDFGKMVYGIEGLDHNIHTLILVEGIFDQIRIVKFLEENEIEGVGVGCTFGNKISIYQVKNILRLDLKKAILFYDIDAIKETKKYGQFLELFFPEVKISCLSSGKDPDEASDQELIDALAQEYEVSEFFYEKVNFKKLSV